MKFKSIDEELKSSFRNDNHRLVVNLIFTHNKFMDKVKSRFKEKDITLQQYNVLRILRGQKGQATSIQLIKDRVMDKNSDISRIIDRLLKKNLITRTNSKTDRRMKAIAITQKGLDKVEDLNEVATEIENFFTKLEADEVIQLNQLLDKSRSQF